MTNQLASPPSQPQRPAVACRPAGAPRRRATSLFSAGEAQVWFTGGALVMSLLMIVGLLALVVTQGGKTFWPGPVVEVQTHSGKVHWGEIADEETYHPEVHAFEILPADRREAALAAAKGGVRRRMLRTGNFELTNTHYTWVSDFEIAQESLPTDLLVVERESWGRFYGRPKAFLLGEEPQKQVRADGTTAYLPPRSESFQPIAEGADAAWSRYGEHHERVRERRTDRVHLEEVDTGKVNAAIEESRLAVRRAELGISDEALRALVVAAAKEQVLHDAWEEARRAAQAPQAADRPAEPFTLVEPSRVHPMPSDERVGGAKEAVRALEAALREQHRVETYSEREFVALRDRIDALNAENARYVLVLETSDGQEKRLPLDEIVLAHAPNRLGFGGKLGVYATRWWEFLTAKPRESNSEGGVLPAIFGTVAMTLIMSLLVVPFGVLAALYLREYAKPGPLVSLVRIAINNLAGVPSIVFGVFGLGFFCYTIGSSIDDLFYPERSPNPTFGTGGLLWASLTLALLTLPVVIVATEEALSAVPRSMREGSYACGASKWQTIRRIVLPRAMPGIMTGMILALARGAGEVAPLMLVGAVKLVKQLPVDGMFPYVHAERSFMHLGFHVYDLGFQSQNSQAAKPMVFTTTLLLIAIVVLLNVVAIWVRSRLRRKFTAGAA